MPEKFERQLPTGIGGEKLKEGRETLPAVEVDNEVAWVNNKINAPFKLKVGERSDLGIFLTPSLEEGQKIHTLEVSGSHTRSGILGRFIFSDKEGRLYRDIDLKGTGLVGSVGQGKKREVRVREVKPNLAERTTGWSDFSSFKGTAGIANQELTRRDVDFSENFLKAGIRTHRVIALIDLKEIIDNQGKKISIQEAKDRGILAKDDEPVIEVRAFGARTRLHDIIYLLKSIDNRTDENKGLKLLNDAENIVAQELNRNPLQFTHEAYFSWLAKTIAINIARMRYNKWVSGYLTSHNITADGRIVDLDSIEIFSEKPDQESVKTYENDYYGAWDSFNQLSSEIRRLALIDKFWNCYDDFKTTYDDELKRLKSGRKSKKSKNL